MKPERKAFKFENIEVLDIKDSGDYIGSWKSVANVLEVLDSYGDKMKTRCFDKVLLEMKSCGKKPKVLYQHNSEDVRGVIDLLEIRGNTLYNEGRIINTAGGRDLVVQLRTGAVDAQSIGYIVGDFTPNKAGIWKDRDITRIEELPEISFVTFPGNEGSRIIEAKSKTVREFEQFLCSNGFSQTEAKTIISNGYKALDRDGQEQESERLQREAEIKAINEIGISLDRLNKILKG